MRSPAKFKPDPFPYHQELVLRIDTLANNGAGIGRVDGWVVFVPFALPGEEVRARVFRNHKAHSEADLFELLEASPHRREPFCPLFGTCGGCQYQSLDYAEQLAWKRRQVAELLQHMAGLETPVDEVVPSPRDRAYRSKLTPHFRKPKDGEVGDIGFLKAGRRFDLVDVPACPIATEAVNARLATLRDEVRATEGGRRKGATLLVRQAGETVHTDPRDLAEEVVDGVRFRYPAGEFFQNNPFILPAFTAHVREEATAGGARFLVDAYCGSGLFALTAARAFEEVTGVEVSEAAVEQARGNAGRNGIGNARFLAASAEHVFAEISHPGSETAVVIDPPRRGSDERFLRQLAAFHPARVVYVSCNPATQMRDLGILREAGYEPTRVRPFDLFPQTKHLECVVTLVAGG